MNVVHKPGSGKHVRRTSTAKNVDAVEELIWNKENAPRTHKKSSDMHSRTRKTLWTSAVTWTWLT